MITVITIWAICVVWFGFGLWGRGIILRGVFKEIDNAAMRFSYIIDEKHDKQSARAELPLWGMCFGMLYFLRSVIHFGSFKVEL